MGEEITQSLGQDAPHGYQLIINGAQDRQHERPKLFWPLAPFFRTSSQKMYNEKTVRLFSFLLLSLIVLSFPGSIFAHGSGPPILLMNGKYANNNPIFTSSTTDIPLGMDVAPENYLVNTQVKFSLTRKNLPAPKEVIDRSTFGWNFADGRQGSGLTVSHTFTKPGTYIVKITVKDPTQNTVFDLNTVQLNILPNKDYSLPQAKIKINGKLVADPLKDTFKVKKGDEIEFDASQSVGDGLSYQWDFGDGVAQRGKTIKHTYAADFFPSFPLLRVTDKNGLYNDTFAEFFGPEGGEGFFPNPAYKVNDSKTSSPTASANSKSKTDFPLLPALGIGGVVVFLTLTFYLTKLRRQVKNK
ncbi:MAG: PKD domain-containing protein [bacterium]|nr:PKD domain-containing protein [bacterium]